MSNLVDSFRSIESKPIRTLIRTANLPKKARQIRNKHRTDPFELNRVSKNVETRYAKRFEQGWNVESCRIIAEDTCQPRASVPSTPKKQIESTESAAPPASVLFVSKIVESWNRNCHILSDSHFATPSIAVPLRKSRALRSHGIWLRFFCFMQENCAFIRYTIDKPARNALREGES